MKCGNALMGYGPILNQIMQAFKSQTATERKKQVLESYHKGEYLNFNN